jgi:hypothetical protein
MTLLVEMLDTTLAAVGKLTTLQRLGVGTDAALLGLGAVDEPARFASGAV